MSHQDNKPDPQKWDPTPSLAWEMPGNPIIRLWQTCWQVLLRPSQAFATLGAPSYLKPILMGLLLVLLTYLFTLIKDISFTVASMMETSPAMSLVEAIALCFKNAVRARTFASLEAPVFIIAHILVLSGPAYFLLRLFKAAQPGFMASFKIMAYAWISISFLGFFTNIICEVIAPYLGTGSGPGPLTPLHYIGFINTAVITIWCVVIAFKGFSLTHQISKLKALGVAAFAALALGLFLASAALVSMYRYGFFDQFN
jgi:hypothetical protein